MTTTTDTTDHLNAYEEKYARFEAFNNDPSTKSFRLLRIKYETVYEQYARNLHGFVRGEHELDMHGVRRAQNLMLQLFQIQHAYRESADSVAPEVISVAYEILDKIDKTFMQAKADFLMIKKWASFCAISIPHDRKESLDEMDA